MAWLVALALILDISTTIIGLGLGLPEAGPIARRIMLVLGIPGYALFEAGAVSLLYIILRRIPAVREWAEIAALGPWLAGFYNMYHIMSYAGW